MSRYNYSSITKVGKDEDLTVKIYFSSITDGEPTLVLKVKLFGMFEPNKTIQAMNLRTLKVLSKDMIIFHLNKFGNAEEVQND